jgi:hypothetical protein
MTTTTRRPSKQRAINLGRIVATPAALEAFDHHHIMAALAQHSIGDWGQMDPEDWATNDAVADALEAGDPDPGRLFSSYTIETDNGPQKLWIITDDPAGEPITTALLPSDY